ncbi:MAG: glycoside hydrolase family 1 protein [Desulfurococcus sp.]|nr:glycoside hydrolase family 1 protein [Desulfurococcus sp.]
MPVVFPSGFLFGTATAAHQVEGDNIYNDWWKWEVEGRLPYKSGKACNHWEMYKQDIELMSKLGYRAYRFSIEWSRLYPREDVFNEDALNRYTEILDLLAKNNIKPMITLHHFTSPAWFSSKGSWIKRDNIRFFLRFVEKVADSIRGVDYWITFNEPNIYILMGFMRGEWPPGYKSIGKAREALVNLVEAHSEAYHILSKRGVRVSIAQNIIPFKPFSERRRDVEKTRMIDESYNWSFIKGVLNGSAEFLGRKLRVKESSLDYIGVNYYSAWLVKHSWNPFKLFIDVKPLDTGLWTKMNYCIYPRGIYEAVEKAYSETGRSVVITENGVSVDDDELRVLSIIRHLQYVSKAVKEGVPVEGYFYWSFIDNYEWDKGFEQRFGLVEVDYNTFERKPRKSAYIYGEIARTSVIRDELLEKYGEKKILD